MRRFVSPFRLLPVLSLLLLSACGGGTELTQQQVNGFIDELIVLLEKGNVRELIENHVDPEVVAEAKEKGDFEEGITRFREKKADLLLACLKQARKGTPTISEDGTEAIYDEKHLEGCSRSIRFRKMNGRWYLLN